MNESRGSESRGKETRERAGNERVFVLVARAVSFHTPNQCKSHGRTQKIAVTLKARKSPPERCSLMNAAKSNAMR